MRDLRLVLAMLPAFCSAVQSFYMVGESVCIELAPFPAVPEVVVVLMSVPSFTDAVVNGHGSGFLTLEQSLCRVTTAINSTAEVRTCFGVITVHPFLNMLSFYRYLYNKNASFYGPWNGVCFFLLHRTPVG